MADSLSKSVMVSSFAAAVFGSSEEAETLAVIPELVVKVPTNFTEL